ncbi:fin bud initiation factor-like [Hoplias malabaricus]|uniref:fin bud initiation factor-like n=1 Tax=Hoplias malabaricus TaxID=27720 RepID=UPI003461F099
MNMVLRAALLLSAWAVVCTSALFTGPLHPEMSNGTFHHYFVPDGNYEDNDDPEHCQMLFRVKDERPPCGEDEYGDAAVREDFTLVRRQAEDAARVLEAIARGVALDLDGEQSYALYLRRETTHISEAFAASERALLELEGKFSQSRENDREGERERERNEDFAGMAAHARDLLRQTRDAASMLADRHELLALVVRSHGARLSRLKNEYLKS